MNPQQDWTLLPFETNQRNRIIHDAQYASFSTNKSNFKIMKDANGSSDKVSSLAYLTELSKGNAGFITEMLDIFLSENPVEIESLENAIAESDYEQIRSISHHMRSTMPFVGLDIHITKAQAFFSFSWQSMGCHGNNWKG